MTFREMLVEDLDQVMDIEEALFSVPWTREGFLTYLMKKDTMFFVVEEKDQILGYCSMMTVLDEGDTPECGGQKRPPERRNRSVPCGQCPSYSGNAGDKAGPFGGP